MLKSTNARSCLLVAYRFVLLEYLERNGGSARVRSDQGKLTHTWTDAIDTFPSGFALNTRVDNAMAARSAIIHDDSNADVLLILEAIECISLVDYWLQTVVEFTVRSFKVVQASCEYHSMMEKKTEKKDRFEYRTRRQQLRTRFQALVCSRLGKAP